MDSVFELIMNAFVSIVSVLRRYELSAYGFTTNFFDFFVAFIILDVLVSILFIIRRVPGSSGGKGSGGSERAPKKGGDSDAE